MFDRKSAYMKLKTLHESALLQPGYHRDRGLEFIEVGEYSLALDAIADAYFENKVRMPPDLFAIFDDLATGMELDSDPEYSAVADLRRFQSSPP